MKPQFAKGNVRANCPDCNAVTTFEYMAGQNSEYGTVTQPRPLDMAAMFKLLRCAGCGRGALAEVHFEPRRNGDWKAGDLKRFSPRTIDSLPLPKAVAKEITFEFREAENCGSASAWNAGSALLRSAWCRLRCGWNLGRRVLRSHEGIVSGCEVNWLIDGLCCERLPAIDFAHIDLA
jgi:hypothetical protein